MVNLGASYREPKAPELYPIVSD